MENYRLAFIHGVDNPSYDVLDGEIEKYGLNEEFNTHNCCIAHYTKGKFFDVPQFQNMSDNPYFDAVAYLLTKTTNSIIFVNTTSQESKYFDKHGKTGHFIMPRNLTDKQKISLIEFVNNISDFNVDVYHSLVYNDGIIESDLMVLGNPDQIKNYLKVEKKSKRA